MLAEAFEARGSGEAWGVGLAGLGGEGGVRGLRRGVEAAQLEEVEPGGRIGLADRVEEGLPEGGGVGNFASRGGRRRRGGRV